MKKIIYGLALLVASAAASPAQATFLPNASAGGPYSFYTIGGGNAAFTVDASATFSPSDLPLTYAWDLNSDGLFNEGTTAILTVPEGYYANAPTGSVFNVAVRVSDPNGSVISFASATSLGPAPVPEPAAWVMMLLGFSAIAWQVRRSSRSSQRYFA